MAGGHQEGRADGGANGPWEDGVAAAGPVATQRRAPGNHLHQGVQRPHLPTAAAAAAAAAAALAAGVVIAPGQAQPVLAVAAAGHLGTRLRPAAATAGATRGANK